MILRTLVKSIFGSRNERVMSRLKKIVNRINQLEPDFEKLSDDAIKDKTNEFKKRLEQGETLEQILPEAFALVREASKRVMGMRHFNVQMIGGMVLNGGNIAEMRTGEGKTLSATLPAYLNALTGKGVHVVTVNDYLASRDAQWMKPLYEALGLTVGVNVADLSSEEKRAAYEADITYGTNNEFGFDYLRDNMAFSLEDKVQRELNYAIIDEVDSILIDEARTPLIISGPSDEGSELYTKLNKIVPQLEKREGSEDQEDFDELPGDFYLDEKNKQAFLTEQGHETVERLFLEAGLLKENDSLYNASNISLMHHLNACLRAHKLFQRDVDYIVKNNEVVIIDEHTGRSMPGRRWSDGLHQAVEAKENLSVQNENQTMASITFQNYFRMYNKLSGMTGTADTEASELHQIYDLEVLVIPTNKPVQRKDFPDQVFLTVKGKYQAVVEEIIACNKKKQPVLVGTASIEASEYLSNLLKQKGLMHQVLNAKFHEKEAHVVEQAGRPGAITIATNMAGRGTDIVLGGSLEAELVALGDNADEEKIAAVKADWQARHDEVIASGGLHIIGSERHESRRIDNQLRGRAARQGDPGSTRFFLALDDPLMRIFASPRVAGMMRRLGLKETDAIEHKLVTRQIESAQRKVETYHFDVRKQLIEYDGVANDQRRIVYGQRNELLAAEHLAETIQSIREEVLHDLVSQYLPEDSLEDQWDIKGLEHVLANDFGQKFELQKHLDEDQGFHEEELRAMVLERFEEDLKKKVELAGEENMALFQKSVMLQVLDAHWKEHLAAMDHLRQGIHLRGYAQKDPKQEYKREAFEMFTEFLDRVKYEVLKIVAQVEVKEEDVEEIERRRQQASAYSQAAMNFSHTEIPEFDGADEHLPANDNAGELTKVQPVKRDGAKVGRNDPCPCGSGKKYKQCCGKLL